MLLLLVWGGAYCVGGNGPAPSLPLSFSCLTGNFRGDSKIGIACYTGPGGKWQIAQSTGTGWNLVAWEGRTNPITFEFMVSLNVGLNCLAGDFNASGKTGIGCALLKPGWDGRAWNNPTGIFSVWLPDHSVPSALSHITFPTGLNIYCSTAGLILRHKQVCQEPCLL